MNDFHIMNDANSNNLNRKRYRDEDRPHVYHSHPFPNRQQQQEYDYEYRNLHHQQYQQQQPWNPVVPVAASAMIPPPPPPPPPPLPLTTAVQTSITLRNRIPPPPPLPIHENSSSSSNNNKMPFHHPKRNRHNFNQHHSNHPKGKSNILVFKGIPPSVSWKDIQQFMTHEYQVGVRYVKLLSPRDTSAPSANVHSHADDDANAHIDVNDNATSSANNEMMLNENHNVQKNARTDYIHNKAYVRLFTHEEALRVLQLWKTNKKNKRFILDEESINIVGIHDSHLIPLSLEATINTSKDEEIVNCQLSQRQQQTRKRQKEEQQLQRQQRQKQRDEMMKQRKQERIERQKQQLLLRNEKEQLSIQKESLVQKKELVHKQELSVQKQISLHKKMLSIMNNNHNSADKTKKMKEILELQKKVNVLKKECLKVMEEIESVKKKEKELILSSSGYSRNASSALLSLPKQYSLDKRTKILKVEGLKTKSTRTNQEGQENVGKKGTENDSNKKDDSDEELLKELQKHFEYYGSIDDVKWLTSNEPRNEQNKQQIEDKNCTSALTSSSNETSETGTDDINHPLVALVHCSSRGVAERIKNDGSNFHNMTLNFSWYHKKVSLSSSDLNDKNNKKCNDKGNDCVEGEEELTEEKEAGWGEDEEMMVDYDYDEEEYD